MDWADDKVLNHSADLLQDLNLSATWLASHDTSLRQKLEATENFDIGLHPNLNNCCNTNGPAPRAKKILGDLLSIYPNAKVIRSHSLTYSSGLGDLFTEQGLTHDLNAYVPWEQVGKFIPWVMPNGLTRVQTGWEDDLEFPIYSEPNWAEWRGVKVLNFHPIHIFLNTPNHHLYESTRSIHGEAEVLEKWRHPRFGTRSILKSLASYLKP